MVGVLVVVGHFYAGSDADLVDWNPTRSPEVEAQNEIDDVRQMVEAQNEMRAPARRPGADEEELRREVAAEEIECACAAASRSRATSVARALIVGCGCRGRELGRAAAGRGLGGARHQPPRGGAGGDRGGRDRAGARRPRPARDACSTWSATSPSSPGCSAPRAGEPEELEAIHGPRLERLLERLVDTPVRGFVYEAAGSSAGAAWRPVRRRRSAAETWRIPVAIVDADPADPDGWAEAASRRRRGSLAGRRTDIAKLR